MRRGHATDVLILLALVAVALVLRGWHVGTPSLWWDELVQVLTADRPLPDVVRQVQLGIPPGFGNTGAMPLDYVLLHLHLALVPRPEPAHLEAYFRFPSLVWSCAAVAAVYACCRRVFDRTVALMAALWLALSVPHVLYAAEVRFYSLMTLLTVLQFWAFATLAGRPSVRAWGVYLVVNVLYLFTGLFAAFALVWQYLVFLGRAARRRERGTFIALAVTGLVAASVPVLWWGPEALLVQADRRGSDTFGWLVVARAALDFFTQRNPVLEIAFLLGVPAMLAAAIWRSRDTLPAAAYLALSCLAIPIIAFFVRSKQYYFHPRHALFLLPLMGIITAAGLAAILRWLLGSFLREARTREATVAAVGCAIVLGAQLPIAWRFVQEPTSFFAQTKTLHDWKGVMTRIAPRAREATDGPLVLIAERESIANAIGWHYLRWWNLDSRVAFWGYSGDWSTLVRGVGSGDGAVSPEALALRIPVGLTEDFRRLLGIDAPIPTLPARVGGWALVAFAPFPADVAAAGWDVDRLTGAEVALRP
jgi:Dolichyl-phosphate-mannose-protein mannosyltransferase